MPPGTSTLITKRADIPFSGLLLSRTSIRYSSPLATSLPCSSLDNCVYFPLTSYTFDCSSTNTARLVKSVSVSLLAVIVPAPILSASSVPVVILLASISSTTNVDVSILSAEILPSTFMLIASITEACICSAVIVSASMLSDVSTPMCALSNLPCSATKLSIKASCIFATVIEASSILAVPMEASLITALSM